MNEHTPASVVGLMKRHSLHGLCKNACSETPSATRTDSPHSHHPPGIYPPRCSSRTRPYAGGRRGSASAGVAHSPPDAAAPHSGDARFWDLVDLVRSYLMMRAINSSMPRNHALLRLPLPTVVRFLIGTNGMLGSNTLSRLTDVRRRAARIRQRLNIRRCRLLTSSTDFKIGINLQATLLCARATPTAVTLFRPACARLLRMRQQRFLASGLNPFAVSAME